MLAKGHQVSWSLQPSKAPSNSCHLPTTAQASFSPTLGSDEAYHPGERNSETHNQAADQLPGGQKSDISSKDLFWMLSRPQSSRCLQVACRHLHTHTHTFWQAALSTLFTYKQNPYIRCVVCSFKLLCHISMTFHVLLQPHLAFSLNQFRAVISFSLCMIQKSFAVHLLETVCSVFPMCVLILQYSYLHFSL